MNMIDSIYCVCECILTFLLYKSVYNYFHKDTRSLNTQFQMSYISFSSNIEK